MININLLPAEKKERTKVVKQNLGFLIFCLSVLIVLAILVMVLLAVRYTLRSNLEGIQNNIESSESALGAYQETKEKILFTKDRLQDLDHLESKKTTWSQNLQSLAQVIPESIELTDFSINTKEIKDEKLPIIISGRTPSRQEAIRFKEQLEVSPFFKDVVFESSKKIIEEGKEYITFTLKASLEKAKGKNE